MKVLDKSDVMKRVRLYIKEKVDVNLYYNDETGVKQWAVSVVKEPEFWLDAFKTKKLATSFCKKHHLKIVKEIK